MAYIRPENYEEGRRAKMATESRFCGYALRILLLAALVAIIVAFV
jgi:hypothetical protein